MAPCQRAKRAQPEKSLHELRTLQQSEDLSDELRARVELSISRIENGLEYYLWLSRLIDAFESHDIFQFVPKKKAIRKAAWRSEKDSFLDWQSVRGESFLM